MALEFPVELEFRNATSQISVDFEFWLVDFPHLLAILATYFCLYNKLKSSNIFSISTNGVNWGQQTNSIFGKQFSIWYTIQVRGFRHIDFAWSGKYGTKSYTHDAMLSQKLVHHLEMQIYDHQRDCSCYGYQSISAIKSS